MGAVKHQPDLCFITASDDGLCLKSKGKLLGSHLGNSVCQFPGHPSGCGSGPGAGAALSSISRRCSSLQGPREACPAIGTRHDQLNSSAGTGKAQEGQGPDTAVSLPTQTILGLWDCPTCSLGPQNEPTGGTGPNPEDLHSWEPVCAWIRAELLH